MPNLTTSNTTMDLTLSHNMKPKAVCKDMKIKLCLQQDICNYYKCVKMTPYMAASVRCPLVLLLFLFVCPVLSNVFIIIYC